MMSRIDLVCANPSHKRGREAQLGMALRHEDERHWFITRKPTTAQGKRHQASLERPRDPATSLPDWDYHTHVRLMVTTATGEWSDLDELTPEHSSGVTPRKYRFTCPLCPMDVQRTVADMDLILDAAAEAGEECLRVNRLG